MKKDYMARLERWARWMLPRQEAEDVISDYREIVADEELRQGLGKPRDMIRPLVQKREYYTWLGVFIALTACLLSAALAPLPLSPSFYLSLWYEWFSGWWLSDPEFSILCFLPTLHLTAGMALCLVWFLRRREPVHCPRSKWMLLCALLLLVMIAYAGSAVWRVSADPEPYFTIWTKTSDTGYSGKIPQSMFELITWLEYGCCALSGLVGTVALVKARTRDRRWAGVFLLALTAAVLSLAVLAMLANFSDIAPNDPYCVYYDGWFAPYLPQFAAITAIGLAGSGVALC